MGVELIYRMLKDDTFSQLSVDDMCRQLGVSHLDLRRYIRHQRGTMPEVSLDLIHEIQVSGLTPSEAARSYYLTPAEIQRVFYIGEPAADQVDKAFVIKKLNEGWTNQEIADVVGCTPARISQIRTKLMPSKRKTRKHLNKRQEQEILDYLANHNVKETAKEFNIAESTVYSIRGRNK